MCKVRKDKEMDEIVMDYMEEFGIDIESLEEGLTYEDLREMAMDFEIEVRR